MLLAIVVIVVVAIIVLAYILHTKTTKEGFRSANSQDIIRTDPSAENSGYRYRGLPETSSLQPMLNPASSESLVRGVLRRDSQNLQSNV